MIRRCALVGGLVVMLVLVGAPESPAQVDPLDGEPLCGAEVGDRPGADDGRLRVATYNILHTQGDYDDETLDRRVELVVEELAAADVDVVGLQEVVRSANHGAVAQRVAAGLAASTGDTWGWCFFQSNPHVLGEPDTAPGGVGGPASQQIAELARSGDAPWAEGVAVLSRFPIEASTVHRLPPRTAEVPFCIAENADDPLAGPTCELDTRTVMLARAATTCGGLDFFTSHLANDESSMSETTRQLQIADALGWIDDHVAPDDAPDVYVGDFNTLEGGPVWGEVVDAGFVDAFRAAEPDADGLTSGQDIASPDATVERRIDFVFARPGSEPVTPSVATILGDEPVPFDGSGGESVVWPSDHYGVAVTLSSVAPCGPAEGVPPVPTASVADGPGRGRLPETGHAVGPLSGLGVAAALAALGLLRLLDPARPPHLP